MKKQILGLALTAITLPAMALAQGESEAQTPPAESPSPNAIVAAAPANEWVAIDAEDLLVMTLAPDARGKSREVVIQLMPAPFSQGWVENIRTLARAKWYDGISVNRVQDNYVVQWGDPGHDNPEGEGIETKPLPEGLRAMGEEEYSVPVTWNMSIEDEIAHVYRRSLRVSMEGGYSPDIMPVSMMLADRFEGYPGITGFSSGWPVAGTFTRAHSTEGKEAWPVHCYGMVGVGRNYSPDTGSGAELYTVIGHAPRHLDRNIALAGRIIDGMEHLSSLPRGSGVLGFYTEGEADLRTPILSIRVASDLPEAERPAFEYLSTESESFAAYAEARANRRDPFFIVPTGGADICNIPVPIRAMTGDAAG
ncbi:peptidylprolyl isomerase [Qipengyuania sp. S6317L1]|uniref:peptidylprolyl isomerase n=1 Tax=Qipengyuania sp. S6317L1 TaxID=2926410 RepID=UPI001FF1D97A|nr:peptidylprolyl isomerase [Qipengyuania sp. S6317L1]MCK0098333.1 peptidylprolyl isomerase [Qipengyuania sp. S6317L1]